jgi:tetratricopeptide (TPR) repeat protein
MPAARKLDLLEQFVAGRGVQVEEATSALAGVLSVPTMGRYPEIEMSPARRRQWTIEVLAKLLVHSVGGSPVLLLIEDLHWADPTTLDLLGEIVAKQTSVPVLLVCTTRPGPQVVWLGQPHCMEIRVEALPPEDTRALVARVAGPKLLPLAVLEEVVARTAGTPLFAEAVTRTLLESDVLRELDDRYELTGPLPVGLIPASVQDSLMGRIDRLGADRPVAQLAATIGRESSFELLQTVLGKSTEALTQALRRLVELDLVFESGAPPASTYTFRHALIQDAAYESLLRKTRQEFHNKIAEALIHRFPEMVETKPELLARHFEGAGRIGEAIAGWMKAGHQAQQRLAFRECVAYLQKAVSLLETLPEDDHGRMQMEMQAQLALGQALTATFGWASRELETAFLRARDLCRKLDNNAGLVQALNGLSGSYFLRGMIPQAFETAKSVLDMSLAMGNPVFEIPARNLAGIDAYFLGDFNQARELIEPALAICTVERERAIFAHFHLPCSYACMHVLSMSLWFLGYPVQAERMHHRGWEMIEALNIPACTTMALGYSLNFHYLRRDFAALARTVEPAYTRAADEGYLFWAAQARIYRGWVQAMKGDPEGGIAEMNAALESYRLTGTGLLTPQWRLMLAEAQLRAGQAEDAQSSLSRGIEHARQYDEHVNEPELHRLRGEIHLGQGDAAAAGASLCRALEIARAQRAKMAELRAANVLAMLWHGQGRMAETRALLEPLCEWFEEHGDTPELHEAGATLEALGHPARATAAGITDQP